nr:trypsin-like peptidase domain-containing protein [uncultured Dongia sp.]
MGFGYRERWAISLGVLLTFAPILVACEGTHVAPVAPLASAAAQGEDLAAIQLDRVVFNLERGELIGHYRSGNFQLCGPSFTPTPIHWATGRFTARDEELSDIFYREMRDAGYNVIGDPDALFGNYVDADRDAEYLVAGRVDSISMDVCNEVTIAGRPIGTQHGSAGTTVTWQVFSTLDRKVVLETRTDGSAELPDGVADGEIALIFRAFAAAARNLGGDPRFHDVLLRKGTSQQATKTAAPLSGWGKVTDQPALAIPVTDLFSGTIGANMARIQASVVTITTGIGQGSGFFVAPNLILTNHHVARNAARLKVTLINGMEVFATTLRSDAKRDVALLQVENGTFTPLPLRRTPVALTEEVYAVGSPLYESLAGTVTRGIVSQNQRNEHGLELIQADVTIQPGSSGGPLLDNQGNVVGLSQSGLTDETDHLVGINFFVPIADALRQLNIVLQ